MPRVGPDSSSNAAGSTEVPDASTKIMTGAEQPSREQFPDATDAWTDAPTGRNGVLQNQAPRWHRS